MATTFSNKAFILGRLWSEYKYDDHFQDFVEYNDLGLPLAYMVDSALCEPTEKGTQYINESWSSLLSELDIEDTGFEHIDDIFVAGEIVIAQ